MKIHLLFAIVLLQFVPCLSLRQPIKKVARIYALTVSIAYMGMSVFFGS